MPDEATQTAEQVNVERVTVAASRQCYRTKFYGLKAFNEGMAGAEPKVGGGRE